MVKCPQAFKEKSFIEALAEAAELGFFLFVLPQIDITPPFCFKRAMYIYIYIYPESGICCVFLFSKDRLSRFGLNT